MLSARLDGEDAPGERELTDRHLRTCARCAAWLDAAAEVTRLARTAPVPAVPDLPVPELTPPRGERRWRARLAVGLRVLLAAIGLAQFLLGAAQVAGLGRAEHAHDAGHLWHESAAWNLAIGAGFAFVALRRTRPVGLLPTLTAFVAVLMLLSAGDIAAGRVGPGRLASHAFLVAGYLVTLALSRPGLDPGEPPARGTGRRWVATFDPPEAPPRLRVIDGGATASVRAPARRRAA